MTHEKDEYRAIEEVLKSFISQVEGLQNALYVSMMLHEGGVRVAQRKLKEFEDENCTVEITDAHRKVQIPFEHYSKWKKLNRRRTLARLGMTLLPRSILVSLLSQFDAFLGRLLRGVFLAKPELLNPSKREITFSELAEFPSIEAAREYIIAKEIENLLREKRSKQFAWMEERFGLPLTKFDSWPVFIEVSQRRNLFVHTDGTVSGQYLSECKAVQFPVDPNLKDGDVLEVSHHYFETASSCIFEVAVKLAHVLWRKFLPESREQADENLNDICYDLIGRGEFKLAITLLRFGVTLPKHTNDYRRRMFVINLAQAYKWGGDQSRCMQVLEKEDWTAVEDQFKLAEAVLKDDWDAAARLMRRIGDDTHPNKIEYRDWPLFKSFRKRKEFSETYREVFGEEFPTEISSDAVEQEAKDKSDVKSLSSEADEAYVAALKNPQEGSVN